MKIFYILLFFFFSSSGNAQSRPVTPDEFEKGIIPGTTQILDVRTAGEYQSGHIKNALQADWTRSKEFSERLEYIDKNRPVFIYCLTGGRSHEAAQWLMKKGFQHVVELEGGINAWKRQGKPVEAVNREKQMSLEIYQSSIASAACILVDFGAPWCPPCVKMEPILNALQKDSSLKCSILKIDAGIHTDLLKELNIGPIPVFIIYKNGRETWRKQGMISREELQSQLRLL